MPVLKKLNQFLEESVSLKYIAQAYTEIAAAKLKKIRAGIEKNRLFASEMIQILHVVEEAAAKRHIKTTAKTMGTISILVTSNYRFNGALENQLIRFFMVNTAKSSTDRLVIGKTGESYLHGVNYFHPYRKVSFATDSPTSLELYQLASFLKGYEQILVYHSKMQSVLIQKPIITDVTQKPAPQQNKRPSLDYIFEPEIDKVLQFFETQIFTLLLEQTFFEAELARTAAKMISMDEAQVNADNRIKVQKKTIAQAKRSLTNLELLETSASLMRWKRTKHKI